MSNPAQWGLKFREARPFIGQVSAAVAGSTHFPLVPGLYQLWSEVDCAVILTDAATDPTAFPTGAQPAATWPGCFLMAGGMLDFEVRADDLVSFGGLPFACTGIRVVQLGSATGYFYCSQFWQERP